MESLNNRERLVQIIDILFEETDEDHLLTLNEIKEKLERRVPGYTAVINTISGDVDFLRNRIGRVPKTRLGTRTVFESPSNSHGAKRYAFPRDEFDTHEIRVLLDAVASARFLTVRDTKSLMEKIKGLTSRHMASTMSSQIQLDRHMKSQNANVKYYLNTVHEAIAHHVKITFQYTKYNIAKHTSQVS